MTTAPETRPDPAALDASSSCYYTALGEGRYEPTLHAQGAWNDWEQHMAPASGLLVHALERHDPREEMQLARITFEILGLIPASPVRIECRTVRPGRTIELVEATMIAEEPQEDGSYAGGKAVIRATAWRLVTQDTAEVAGGFHPDLARPDEADPWDGTSLWGGGFIRSLEFRSVAGGEPGRGQAWLTTHTGLVAGEESSEVARFVGLVDTANGIAVREHPGEWMFPNVDLTIHLFRRPRFGWLGLNTEVTFGETGLGITSSDLYDEHGPVGGVEQILTVRRLPGS
ncbi:thioesterase family protein [Arsenicicoccus dermatophilus]|uniref:thioesterase family protein n=1 Tax=Arsenicicoccus dermatophilus TaxID=1076331 RepID=UPI001F4C7AB6|nr:thioesterase family protein [Arsenicicoccus dermatophilus]